MHGDSLILCIQTEKCGDRLDLVQTSSDSTNSVNISKYIYTLTLKLRLVLNHRFNKLVYFSGSEKLIACTAAVLAGRS